MRAVTPVGARRREATGAPPTGRDAPAILAGLTLVLMLAGCGGGDDGAAATDGAAGGGDGAPVRSVASAAEPSVPTASVAGADAEAGDAAGADGAGAGTGAGLADGRSSIVATSPLVDEALTSRWPAARFGTAGLVPAEPQRAGDPERGRLALVEEGYVACGLPARVVGELLAGREVTTYPEREAAARDLPFSMNLSTDANGVEIASSNCLTCHGTPLFGELVVGLGNEFLDFTEDPSLAVERAGALVRGPAETQAWERYADRVQAIAPHMTMRTVGTNPANNLTFALIAHRDAETAAWSEEPLLPLPTTEPPPVSVPPWWRMAKKHAMFNLGEGRRDHARIMMAASMLCTDSIEELEAIDVHAPDIRAYIGSLEPPAWPFGLDAERVARGRGVFETNCSVCHGRYAVDAEGGRVREEDEYPNRLVPIEVVGSDPTLVEHAYSEAGTAYSDWFNRSWYGRLSTAAPGPGYVAPPLDGVWATGPFLHNGSVPSVRALLDSGTRPARWAHRGSDASDPENYDEADLGWRFDADEDTLSTLAPERVYDTSRPGHANGGHRFGDHLSGEERDAVIEYLKAL